MKILVVDDERALVKGIKFNLENEGYTVDCGYDGNDAVNMAKKNNYDLIILDLMMPGKDGLEACQEIRSFSTVPVIMLTARSERHDLLLGFESGADDYITKPFDVLELKARVRALLRRAGISTAAAGGKDAGTVSHAQITLDEAQRSAFKDGKEVELTMKDYSREKLLDLVWGYDYLGDSRTVDVHIRRLREKLERDPASPELILTKWGVGYYFTTEK